MYGGQVVAARELQAMNEEVKHLARHINELEDREIEVMEALEPLDGGAAGGRRAARDALDTDAERLRAAIGAAERALDAEIADGDPGARRGGVGSARRPARPLRAAAFQARAAPGRPAWWAARAAGAT